MRKKDDAKEKNGARLRGDFRADRQCRFFCNKLGRFFLYTEVENEKENDASGVHSFKYSLAWDGGTDRMQAGEKEYNRYKKKQATVQKEVPKKKKVRGLTDSPMNLRWIWNMPKVFRYIITKTAIE